MRVGTFYRAALLRSLGLAGARGRVLDVGGYDGFWLSALPAERRISVDVDPKPGHAGVSFVRGDGARLPFPEGAFDAVFALDVLEHVDDEQRFLSELLRVLRPGGRLILTTPHERIRIFPGLLTPWVNRRWQHYRTPGYMPEVLQRMLAADHPRRVRVRQLRTWTLRHLYLPLSASWRLWRRPTEPLVRWFAALDARQAEGPCGYLLAEIEK